MMEEIHVGRQRNLAREMYGRARQAIDEAWLMRQEAARSRVRLVSERIGLLALAIPSTRADIGNVQIHDAARWGLLVARLWTVEGGWLFRTWPTALFSSGLRSSRSC